MSLKNLESLRISDLQELKDNSVCESKTLEYKKELKLKSDSEKKEFLADISSFANTSGGDIIYGIAEKGGVPYDLIGIGINDLDLAKQQIENILRDGLEPRVSGILIKEIEKQVGVYYIIIRVPKSWNSPHRLSIKDSKRFYARNTNGKYELEINELRRAFMLSDSIPIKLRSFCNDRISKITSSDCPLNLIGERKVILHIVPLISLSDSKVFDIKIINNKLEYSKPLGRGGWDRTYNFDGIISSNGYHGDDISSYTQFFKNGIIEAVTTQLIFKGDQNLDFFPNSEFEKDLFEGLRNYFSFYDAIRIDYPVYVLVTFLNYKGVRFCIEYGSSGINNDSIIDRDVLKFPEVFIESSQLNFHNILRPIFDSLWNTCGYERCLNYDNFGNYHPQ